MNDLKVTCPSCRGAREMMKLGGIFGECRLCAGEGKIFEKDFPKPIVIVPAENILEVTKKVAEAVPWVKPEGLESKAIEVQQPKPIHETIKIERKKAIYKKK